MANKLITSLWLIKIAINRHDFWFADDYVVNQLHDDVIKWKHFPRNWPFVREIHRSPMNFLHKGQWREALIFSLIYAWINDWVNNREAGDLRRQYGHYDVIVMMWENHRPLAAVLFSNWHVAQILQCNIQISHKAAPFCNRNVHMYAHFVGCMFISLWDWWDGSIGK